MTNGPILTVKDLKTHFFTKAGIARAVDGADLSIRPGEILGLVGESGCGKSVTGFSILGLIDPPGRIVEGNIVFKGEDLVAMPEKELRRLRGRHIAMIFQDPLMTLNPVLRIDTQMVEAIRAHRDISQKDAIDRCTAALQQVGIPSAEKRLREYPHQFSGGMRQRVAIATAMLNEPDLIIADEPTTALDVTIQAQILYEVQKLCREKRTAVIWITHDLAVIAGLADRVCVMYAGRIVEEGPVDDVIDSPLHPYTAGLIGSVPGRNRRGRPLFQIPGMAPSLIDPPAGCAFRMRCGRADEACMEPPPFMETVPGRMARCVHPLMHTGEYTGQGKDAGNDQLPLDGCREGR
jgi:peptide/nickel transport system ATP-binding protein